MDHAPRNTNSPSDRLHLTCSHAPPMHVSCRLLTMVSTTANSGRRHMPPCTTARASIHIAYSLGGRAVHWTLSAGCRRHLLLSFSTGSQAAGCCDVSITLCLPPPPPRRAQAGTLQHQAAACHTHERYQVGWSNRSAWCCQPLHMPTSTQEGRAAAHTCMCFPHPPAAVHALQACLLRHTLESKSLCACECVPAVHAPTGTPTSPAHRHATALCIVYPQHAPAAHGPWSCHTWGLPGSKC